MPRFLLLLSLLLTSFAATAQTTDGAPQFIEGPQTAAPAEPPTTTATMNNDSILKMARAGLGEDLIIQTINTQPGKYLTDPDALVILKQAGISDPIISAMMNKSRRLLTPAHETPIVLSDVNEIGVYYKDRNGKWIAIEPEIVHLKSGGFIKSTVTNGVIKQDRNGHIDGRESALLRFRLNSSSREFRTYTGGVFHSTSGAQRDEVPFKPVKTAPHTYQFTVDQKTPGGEYGILPPGTGNITNGGKIYTFAISE